jgi:hypothetical protein
MNTKKAHAYESRLLPGARHNGVKVHLLVILLPLLVWAAMAPLASPQTHAPVPPTERPEQPAPPPPPPALKGFVDLHAHPLTNVAFGGKLIYGGVDIGALLPADPDCNHNVRATSEQQALGHDKSTHGGWGLDNLCGDYIRATVIHKIQQKFGADFGGHDETSGAPDFPDWPVWNDVTHQKMWVEWIRRAHQGGLRVMVALATNSKTLGDMTAGPGDYPTDDKTSADLQIAEIKGLVGRHSDFMEIAYTSADLYRIVSANKLAVVIGIEVDDIGDFQIVKFPLALYRFPPSDADVTAEIDRLYGEGVRYIFPIHLRDNAFGGTAAYESLFDAANVRDSGHPWALVCANPADPKDNGIKDHANGGFTYDNSALDLFVVLGQLGKSAFAVYSINSPQCSPGIGQKNSLALTESGLVAIKEMMRLGMLIDIDHMSQAATDSALKLASQFTYPVNSGHNGLRGALSTNLNERALRADQYATIGALHGMAGVGSVGLDAQQWLTLYNKVYQAMGGGSIVGGFGTDTGGLQPGMPPRPGSSSPGPDYANYQACISQSLSDCIANCGPETGDEGKATGCIVRCNIQATSSCRRKFPNAFVSVAGSSVQYSSAFPPSTDGNKTWNYNVDGVAHYGMLWDFLQDVRSLPGGDMVDNQFMNGADYFFHTWQIAEAKAANVK